MNDFLYRGLIKGLNIRFAYANTPTLCNEVITRHDCDPVVGHIMSRALTAGVLCSPILNGDERYTINWQYPGPIGKVIVDVGAQADVRGTSAVKHLMDQVETEADVYGDSGHISLIKSTEKLTLNSGTTQATILDIVTDLCMFFSISDQLETDMYIAVGFNPDPKKPVDICQGMLLQAMPGCDYEAMERIRNRMHHENFKTLMAQQPESDNHFEKLLQAILKDEEQQAEYEIHACNEPQFKCRCNHDKTLNVLRTLNENDVKEIEAHGEDVKVACQFCSTVYLFSPQEVRKVVIGD